MSLGNKNTFAENLKYYMDKHGIDRNKLCHDLDFKYMTVSDWINAKTYPRIDRIEKIANYFKIKKSNLVEDNHNSYSIDNNIVSITSKIVSQLTPPRQTKVYNYAEKQLDEQNGKIVPMLGQVAANPNGITYVDETFEEYITDYVPDKADGALTVNGDSMEPEFKDRSIVFFQSVPFVENGELAIVEIDNSEVAFKKVIYDYENNNLILKSLNPRYENRIVKSDRARIIGKVVRQ